MGCDHLGCREDRLHRPDIERLGEEVGSRHRKRPGASTDMTTKMKSLERENRELRQAEILRKTSAYFAQAELDRRSRLLTIIARSMGSSQSARICRLPLDLP
jgi:transposase-like protein